MSGIPDRSPLIRLLASRIVEDHFRELATAERLAIPPATTENAPDARSVVRPLLHRPATADLD